MQIHLLMCTKNEADRYLQSCLLWHSGSFSSMFVYDDRSDDDTVDMALDCGAVVAVRSSSAPSFMEHEGAFRQNALNAFEVGIEPYNGDWVLVLDADEFVLGAEDDLWNSMTTAIAAAVQRNSKSIRFARPEIWSCAEIEGRLQHPYIRTDGLWNTIRCCRLYRWQPGGEIQQKAMGCGNEPTYVNRSPVTDSDRLTMLHLGYVDEADRLEKHQRYASLADHGHNRIHIDSIIARPELDPWTGPWVPVWRGA